MIGEGPEPRGVAIPVRRKPNSDSEEAMEQRSRAATLSLLSLLFSRRDIAFKPNGSREGLERNENKGRVERTDTGSARGAE